MANPLNRAAGHKGQLATNIKAAKPTGLAFPLFGRADEVIE
jgi:hypothetical protein